MKILIIDIETKPTKAWVWRGFKENVAPEQVIEAGEVICFGAQWLGSRDVLFFSEWGDGRKTMLKAASDLLSEADIVVGFNQDKFDIPHLRTEFLLEGIEQPGPLTSVDCLKTIKKELRLFSNRLKFVGPYFKIGKKIEHEGFSLWTKVLDGDERAQKRMERYCKQDVRLTGRLYKFLRPVTFNHPNVGHTGEACSTCGSHKTQKRGKRYTRHFAIQRHKCNSCKSWFETKRTKIKTNGRRD